jgi:AraC-like DNA-binding protein
MCASDAFFHYLPVNEEAMAGGMYVIGGGRAIIRPGERYPPSGHPKLYQFDWSRGRILPEFQLVLVTEGQGEFESEPTGHVQFEGAALFFLFPGVWHRYRPSSISGWTERWITFNGDLVHRLLELGSFGPLLALTKPRDPAAVADEYDLLLNAIRTQAVLHPAVLTFRALRLIALAVAQGLDNALESGSLREFNTRTVDDPVVQKALELIWTHSPAPMSVIDIARELPVTRRTLDRRFVEATGHSVLEEINACRISRAKRLLAETDLPVKTVTHLAGFSSSERMRVVFVNREGLSPSNYRRRTAMMRGGWCNNSSGETKSDPLVLKKG